MEAVNNNTSEHPDISHIPNGMEQMIERARNMSSSEWDAELKRIKRDQMAVEEAIRQDRMKRGWDGVPLGRRMAEIEGKGGDEALQRLRSAKTEDEYQEARAEIVRQNKLREGGSSPDVPYTLPKTEWRALCALCSEEAWEQYGSQFTEDLFTDTDRKNVLKALKGLAEEGRPMDVTSAYTVFERLGIDFPSEWLEWLTSSVQTYHLPYMLKDLRTMAKKREYDNTMKAATALLEDGSVSLETIGARLREVAEDSPVEEVATLGDASQEVIRTIQENREAITIGTHTGFTAIDVEGGFQAGDFIVLAGDTSNGKTSFALSVTLNAIREKSKIAYYSLEMPKKRLAARLIAMHQYFSLTSSRILRDRLWDDEVEAVNKVIASMPQTELLFDDKATIKFDDLLGSIRMMAKKYNVKGVVVDYLQILNVNDRGKETQEQMMAQVARKLKNVAIECNIWVMALSQLSRDKNKPEPTLARLRDSGQIAEAADIVMLIYRPELYGLHYSAPNQTKMTKDTAQIDIAKGRDIGTKKFLVGFEPRYTYFFDTAVENDPMAIEEEKTSGTAKSNMPKSEPKEADMPF